MNEVKTRLCDNDELIATVYVPKSEHIGMENCHYHFKHEFVSILSPFYKGEKWAVRYGQCCLNKDSEWEREPSPSYRTAKFCARCRFDSLGDAIAAFNKRRG
jgi:hypothetical protein